MLLYCIEYKAHRELINNYYALYKSQLLWLLLYAAGDRTVACGLWQTFLQLLAVNGRYL